MEKKDPVLNVYKQKNPLHLHGVTLDK